MHFHYYTLERLATWLNENHQGEKIYNCFSQSRNELVIELENIFLRVGCHTPQTYLIPVNEFAKARKNVVDLFEEMRGRHFSSIRVVPFEREMVMELEDGYDVVFKLHNVSANVLLRYKGEVVKMFNNQQEEDLNYVETPGEFHKDKINEDVPPDQDLIFSALKSVSPIFSRPFSEKIYEIMQEGSSFSEAVKTMLEEVKNSHFAIRKSRTNIKFFLFASGEENEITVQGVDKALLLFLRASFQYKGYLINYREVEKVLEKPYKKFQKVYTSYQDNITKLEKERDPEEIGHIIMANLHAIKPHINSVELDDFYQNSKVKIKLDPRLSAQDNASKYYKKSKQRKGKVAYLRSQLDDIQDKWEIARDQMEEFRELPTPESLVLTEDGLDVHKLRELKKFARFITQKESEDDRQKYPFRTYHKEGFDIFVGKGGKNNDELSFKFASKEDLWLHAKDVPGSHVIIRHRAGKPIPITVLEYAAGLAAYYSKKKNDTLVPVQYTPRKYIRKRKGDPPGLVAVDREEVIMIEPAR